MEIAIGTQLTLNQKPAVVLAVTPFADCTVVTLLRPGLLAPPMVEGRTRPGAVGKKIVSLLTFPDGSWFWDYDHPARVAENRDPRTHVDADIWMAAFARHIHAPVLR